VSLGEITKQIAKEALGAQVEGLVGNLRPGEQTRPDAAPESGDGLAFLVIGEVRKMQAALPDDKELLVQCFAGGERLRIVEMFAPASRLLVLTALDTERTVTRVLAGVDSLQLTCKPVPVKEGAKPLRLRLVASKA
jgi:hypothetical protein